MGQIGRYIDSLPAEARDRIIEGRTWTTLLPVREDGARCLIGHAAGASLSSGPSSILNFVAPDLAVRAAGERFDVTAARFGVGRLARACKLRAGRGNAPALPAEQPATSAAGAPC